VAPAPSDAQGAEGCVHSAAEGLLSLGDAVVDSALSLGDVDSEQCRGGCVLVWLVWMLI
jgi:hypothetical protein